MRRSVAHWLAPLIIAGFIWFLSDQPDLKSGLDSDVDLVLRKLAHMTVFGALLVTLWRASGPRTAVVLTLAYAALDEWHQTWVEGRNGAVHDWAIDALGAGVAAALVVWRLRRRAPTSAGGARPGRTSRAGRSRGGP